jgi:hypothetical protein
MQLDDRGASAHDIRTARPRPPEGRVVDDVQRGTPRDAPVAGEDGECNSNESSAARPWPRQQDKSSRSIRSGDHGDGVISRSGRAGPAKRLSGRVLQPPARISSAHSTTQGARPRTSTRQQQRQGAVVMLLERWRTRIAQSILYPRAQRSWAPLQRRATKEV